jgi:hypothetical protein
LTSEEEHIVQVEQENIYLREQVRKVKFCGEKDGYGKFLNGLTVLKKQKELLTKSIMNFNDSKDSSPARTFV